ncbi:ATP-binding protein [Catenulispora sp. NF23]|uniref:ATP-binding protein n=1 Tax=Catenulispora pinistramenti TaxID=2705254 RepID=A0ABS5KNJ9_9ACTN|nr:ATP-binding SpoIIE family protein phosphatase [Catenulispora pinistramenti]MBS2532639.1 ATP-binding protein [Catenulispora pinistramenti]MBS2547604.1 ATP-binding protein [Catenulispora pinistramenti]
MDALTTGAMDETWIRQDVSSTARARRAAAELARRVGMSAERVGQIELAVTEAAVNLTTHADDGALLLRLIDTGPAVAVELLAIDHGPGIADLDHARRTGVSTAGTPGLGLGVVERMADSFDVHSVLGRGTVLVARFRDREKSATPETPLPEPTMTGLTRPLSGEQVCGDAWSAKSVVPKEQTGDPVPVVVMLCDGLGHGPLAARASGQAVAVLHRGTAEDPKDIINEFHHALAGTRGGAVAVARIDWHRRRIDFCGIGNVSAFVVADDARSSLLSSPGIVGHHLPRLRGHEAALPPGASVVFHSDGLTERWSPAAMPGLFAASSTLIAAHLLREAGVRRDDASVLVVKDPAAPGARS